MSLLFEYVFVPIYRTDGKENQQYFNELAGFDCKLRKNNKFSLPKVRSMQLHAGCLSLNN